VPRVEFESVMIGLGGCVDLSGSFERESEVEPGGDIAGVRGEQRAVRRDSFGGLACARKRNTEIETGLAVVGANS